MPLPLAATLAIAAAPSLLSMGQSIFQRNKANNMNVQRPPDVPLAVRESTDLARQMAGSSRMSGQGFEEENIRNNQASSTRAAQMAGGGPNYLAAVSGINANTNRAYGQLGMRAAQWRDRNMQMLMQNLGRVGSYQQQGAMAKFNEEAGTKSALTNAANQNMYGAFSGMSMAGLYAMGKFGGGANTTGAGANAGASTSSVLPPMYRPSGYGMSGMNNYTQYQELDANGNWVNM
jgi:hypothetical protein